MMRRRSLAERSKDQFGPLNQALPNRPLSSRSCAASVWVKQSVELGIRETLRVEALFKWRRRGSAPWMEIRGGGSCQICRRLQISCLPISFHRRQQHP